MSESSEQPILLTAFPNEALAAIFVANLREEGIESATTGGMTAGLRAEAPGMVRVLVHKADEAKAREILEAFQGCESRDPES
jgi:Putative prokaryotic signal transducing protein